MVTEELQSAAVAIIGMSGRFPGADSVTKFWENLCEGRESISTLREEDLEYSPAAADGATTVNARGILKDVDLFDADFFHFLPREAELADPQHRALLECAWLACEDAGYDPGPYPGNIGVFAGSSINTYLLLNLGSDRKFIEEFTGSYQTGSFPALVGNGQDFLATRISYKLGLRGPSMTVQSACSTSLLAVAQACDCLRRGDADMALAGGVSISFPQMRGYQYQEGGMVSPDGHCRPFDAGADGTVFGAGVGMVLLKRLDDAVKDGDHIYAAILGHGVNNDGSSKVGYAAPSIEGQAAAIERAHRSADVNPETIGYVECHGTGTRLGDPIEIEALARAFRTTTRKTQFCAVGSVKGAVGHLDVAAGVTGLIKTALCLENEAIPPTLHFEKPNPYIDFADSPFFVNGSLAPWTKAESPRRAGVSAFGVGGTNVHLVLEEAPKRPEENSARTSHLLTLSARTESALVAQREQLSGYLQSHSQARLEDISYTLATGRREFPWRLAVAAGNAEEAIASLSTARLVDSQNADGAAQSTQRPEVAFLFPGQGAQYPGMGQDLYDSEPVYRNAVDRCALLLHPLLDQDLRQIMYPAERTEAAADRLRQTQFAQPALFVTAFATAQLWMEWGIFPGCFAGHSVGEFVAACLGGVLSLEDALRAIVLRGSLMQGLPEGGMLAVRMSESDLAGLLDNDLAIAAVNSPSLCVVAGPLDALNRLERQLSASGQTSRLLHTSHAFHSAVVDPIVEPLERFFGGITLQPSTLPIFSCVTGEELTDVQATDPLYWARHCRETVRFYPALLEMERRESAVYLEVGPGSTLSTLARQSLAPSSVSPGSMTDPATRTILHSLPSADSSQTAMQTMQSAAGALWTRGFELNWPRYFRHEPKQRISLPSAPFDRKRYWIERTVSDSATTSATADAANPLTTEPSNPMNTAPTLPIPSAASESQLLSMELALLLEELSGVSIDQDGRSSEFIELGFDSLFLTQVTQEIQRRYGVKVTFRQMLEDISSIDALTQFLLPRLSPEALARLRPAAAAPAISPTPTPVSASAVGAVIGANTASATGISTAPQEAPSNALETLLQAQMKTLSDLFQQQLQLLSQQPVASPAPPPVAQPVSTPLVSAPRTEAATPEAIELRSSSRLSQRAKTEKSSAALSPAQQDFLSGLITRYCARTAASKNYAQQYRRVLADPRSVSGFHPEWKEMVYSIVCESSSGSKIRDLDGNEYIDLLNGFGPTMFGHEPAFVVAAVKEQLDKSFAIGPQTPLAGKTAELVSELTGCERVTFCNTGSEAVMAAMRAARTVTGRDKVVYFAGDYHGQFDEVLVKGIRRGEDYLSLPVAPGIPRKNIENTVVLEYGEPSALAWIEKHAGEIAAVIVEPVQSRHPALQPKEFLHSLRELTERTGSALVFDEVVTGFRIHPGGAQAYYGVRADMATFGKVAGGGMPIGILAGNAKFMDAFDGGPWQFGDNSYPEIGVTFFAGTFVRHPLSIAATYATLQHIKKAGEQLYLDLDRKSAAFAEKLNTIFAARQLPVTVERCGSIMYLHLPNESRHAGLFYYLLREKGVFFLEGFPLYLTTEHSEADLARVYEAFEQSLDEMQAVGLLAGKTTDKIIEGKGIPTTPAKVEEFALTAPQLEVLLAAQAGDEANCAFNEGFSIYLDGKLDRRALTSAWEQLVARHESLRMSLNAAGDAMRIATSASIPLETIDLSSLSPEEQAARIEQLIVTEGKTPFDLQALPLVRAKLLSLSAERHQLVMTAHHMVCDGWSINVLVAEWGSLYSSLVHSGTPELSPVLNYSAYARQTASASSDGAIDFWKQELQPIPELLDLPSDSSRRAERTFAGATCIRQLSPELTKAVRKAGASQGCTLFVTLLGAWQILLSRLSGQEEFVTLIPAAAQSQFENSSLVGHCVHLLPIRARVQPGQPAKEILRQAKQRVLNAYDHQQATYGSIVHALHLAAPAGRLPLSEVQFNLERVAQSAGFHGLKTKVEANGKQAVNFDIFLNIVESDKGLRLECDYNTDLYRESTIERWLDHYRTLLESLSADTTANVASLPLLNDTLKQSLLVERNATAQPYPQTSIPELIRVQAERSPDAIAVEFYGSKLTRRQLEERTDELAAVLRGRNIGAGHLVGIYVERSIEMVVAVLGVLKSGAGYVPLDPLYPKERIQGILGATRMSLLLTLGSHRRELPESAVPVLTLDHSLSAQAAPVGPASEPTSASTAYVIFTSGSTGAPKGVEITHRSVVNLLYAAAKEIHFHAGDRLLAVTTLTFDIAALELLLPLTHGGTVVIASREDSADGGRVLELLRASRSNVLQATPITWRMMLESGFKSWSGLKMLCGGEAWGRELANQLLADGARLWNMYGPTETTIWSSISEVKPGDEPISIGRPLANTQFYVLDESMQPVPPGVAGELYIGGDGLARGYYNHPELTAARFLPNPFMTSADARVDKTRVYKTGDLVRQSEDGSIQYLRRNDQQIKLRGFRIELGEIESAIQACAPVSQVAVMLRQNASGEPALAAYLVPQQKQVVEIEPLRSALLVRLPEYMVPSQFAILEEFPLTANGKVDRKALLALELAAAPRNAEYTAPSTDRETLMAGIWSEVLAIPEIGVDDDLLALGADSLRMFQIASRCTRAGIPVTARQLMKLRTIRAIAKELDKPSTGNPSPSGMGPILRVSRDKYRISQPAEIVAAR